MKNLSCGVLFCGGCNPRFDRLKLYQDLKEELKQIQFDGSAGQYSGSQDPGSIENQVCGSIELEYFQEGKTYDITLLINGCSSECLMNDQYPGQLVLINNGNLEEAIGKFQRILESDSAIRL